MNTLYASQSEQMNHLAGTCMHAHAPPPPLLPPPRARRQSGGPSPDEALCAPPLSAAWC